MGIDTASHPKVNFIRSVVLFHNEQLPEAVKWVSSVRAMLRARGIQVWLGATSGSRRLPLADIAIVLGGDGTMLRAARLLAPKSVPLLGINAGGLGFLSGTDVSEFRGHLNAILTGKFVLEERWMLSVEVYHGRKQVFGPHITLNDCVIRCGDTGRAIMLKASCDDFFVADYFGDGLILSTPTGSTAYALAAGGPVVDPRLDAFLVVPICPHTLTQRPLIIPAKQPVVVRLVRRNPNDKPAAQVYIDGQTGCSLRVGSEVHIRRHEKPLKLLVNPKRSYFEVLHRKLQWGER